MRGTLFSSPSRVIHFVLCALLKSQSNTVYVHYHPLYKLLSFCDCENLESPMELAYLASSSISLLKRKLVVGCNRIMMKVFVHVRCKNLSNSWMTKNKENKRAISLNNHKTQARANFKRYHSSYTVVNPKFCDPKSKVLSL